LYRIAITTKGKYTALEAEAIEPLVELVSDPDSEVRTYALKVGQFALDQLFRRVTETSTCTRDCP